MEKLDLIHEDLKEVKTDLREVRSDVVEIKTKLAVVEDRTTRRSAFIAAIVGFLSGLVGR